jgi:hypothetical protein
MSGPSTSYSRDTALRAVHTALELWCMVGLVTAEEFHRHEDRHDHDSGQGRELLFLIANHEWVRGTSEIVDIDRSDAIETALKIDLDLRQITHEAFRGRTGRLWLPVTVLPQQTVQGHHEPDPFATVTDAADNLLPLMPAEDLWHQMSAGMAEIIVNMAIAHLPGRARESSRADPSRGQAESIRFAARDDRVLLSAAVHRLLRLGSDPAAEAVRNENVEAIRDKNIESEFAGFASRLRDLRAEPDAEAMRFRLAAASYRLRWLLAAYITYLGQYAEIPAAETAVDVLGLRPSQFAPKLAFRAVRVLQALAASTVIAVPLDIDSAPTVLTVRVPARRLRLVSKRARLTKPKTWLISPSAHLQIDVLLPTADADRQVQIHLADGISFDEPRHAGRTGRSATAARLDIAVQEPSPVQDLSVSMQQVLRDEQGLSASMQQVLHDKDHKWPFALTQWLGDLARAKAALVVDALRHYEVRGENDAAASLQDGKTLTDLCRESLEELSGKLRSVTDDAASLAQLRNFWQESGLDGLNLFRRTSVDPPGPRALVARAEMIEDVAQRATPETAVIHADVRVADREYFSITRTSAKLSLLVMTGILIAIISWHFISPKSSESSLHPEVLAIVLTLFATIQASRVERPDRSTLQGELSASGTGMLAASMLPPVALAVALAFQPTALVASSWALVFIAVQMSFLVLMRWWWGPSLERREHGERKRRWFTLGDRRKFETEHLDYGHFEVLRSDYWRNTTADALMLGRMAYGYVIRHGTDERVLPDKWLPPRLEPLLMRAGSAAEPDSVLALLHSSTQRQAVTFVVFREKRDDLLAAGRDQGPAPPGTRVDESQELDLDPNRLAAMDNVSSQVDVFIGQLCDLPVLQEHPLVAALKLARGMLIVLEAQLPFPTPVTGYPGRQWARLRVALRDDGDIRRLTEFLYEIYLKIAQPGGTTHVVAVQVDPTVLPRAIDEFVKPSPGDEVAGPGEDAGDFFLPAGSAIWDEDPSAVTWWMAASCEPARSNIESDIIDGLGFDESCSQLAHLNYARLHGMAAVIVLLHERNDGAGNPHSSRPVPDGQAEYGGDPDSYWSRPYITVKTNVSRRELGPFEKCQLLHIRFRWQDHPGAFLDVLDSIDAVLDDNPPAIRRAGRSVSYARLFIANGQVAEGDLTVRLHSPPRTRLMTEQLAQRISARALEASAGHDSRVSGGHPDEQQKPVIRIDLLGKLSPTVTSGWKTRRRELEQDISAARSERQAADWAEFVRYRGKALRLHRFRWLAVAIPTGLAAVVIGVAFAVSSIPNRGSTVVAAWAAVLGACLAVSIVSAYAALLSPRARLLSTPLNSTGELENFSVRHGEDIPSYKIARRSTDPAFRYAAAMRADPDDDFRLIVDGLMNEQTAVVRQALGSRLAISVKSYVEATEIVLEGLKRNVSEIVYLLDRPVRRTSYPESVSWLPMLPLRLRILVAMVNSCERDRYAFDYRSVDHDQGEELVWSALGFNGPRDPIARAFREGAAVQISNLRYIPVTELIQAASIVSPCGRDGLGTFDRLSVIHEVDALYLFFEQLRYLLEEDSTLRGPATWPVSARKSPR